MQLTELIETHGLDKVVKETKISKRDLEVLLNQTFENIPRVKTIGFIGILEREFKVDLSEYRAEALEHYDYYQVDHGNISVGIPMETEQKQKSKLLRYIILILLLIALWLFWQKFQQHGLNFNDYIPLTQKNDQAQPQEKNVTLVTQPSKEKSSVTPNVDSSNANNLIVSVINKPTTSTATTVATSQQNTTTEATVEDKHLENSSTNTTKSNHITNENNSTSVPIVITPKKKLWFGVINTTTKKRQHFIKSEPYLFDTTQNSWLVATSSAYFSLTDGNETQAFQDAKSHYFFVDTKGATELTKKEFIARGGWRYW
jgi:cytoskeletal protein RodZ